MFKFFNKKEPIKSNNDFWNIKSLNILSWIFIIIFSWMIIYIIKIIFWNYDTYKLFLDYWYNYSILFEYIKNNNSYFLTFIIAYLLFIGFIWAKKWLLNNSETYNNYYQIISYIYKWLTFLLIPFLYYLFKNNNIFEMFVLIFIVYGFNILLWLLLSSFSKNFNNINSLNFLNNKDNFQTPVYNDLNRFFNSFLPYFIGISITFSFLIIPVWLLFRFNIFSILYLHLSFFITFISLNLMTNKFAWLIDIKYNWKMLKWYFLLENTKEKVIIKNEKETLILKPEKVDYILFKNKEADLK